MLDIIIDMLLILLNKLKIEIENIIFNFRMKLMKHLSIEGQKLLNEI